jgi:CheY-like chemotaxis protein
MSTKRTTVLFVDDDPGFLDAVQNLMRTYSEEQWEVLVALDAAGALAFIRENRIDLLVIDLHMPVMDGLQFLALLHRKYPQILKVALTGDASEPYRAACLSNGAELFLEKPTSPEGWQRIYSALSELARLQPEEGFRGVLRRVGLQDVLQMECLARSSSVLEVSAAQMQGEIFVETGQIVHARAGDLAGEEAFNYLMSLGGGQFHLKPFAEPPARTISGSWEFLLMEAAQKRDESRDPLGISPFPSVEPAAARAAAEEIVAETAPLPVEAEVAVPSASSAGAEPVLGLTMMPAEEAATPRSEAGEVLRPKIDEFLICSAQGDVLYEWQCADVNARIRFLQFISQKSWQLRQGMPIGHFERLEIEGTRNRIVTQIETDRALFVRASRAPEEQPG